MSWVATGMTVVSGISSYVGGKKAERAARKRQKKLQAKLRNLEANRQAIINPYEGSTNLSGMLTDHSGSLTNPYANLSVATKAAEMQIEQSDIALANTLDTIRASGYGAGGATALAMAAAKSKKEVSASLETQEVNNQKLRAEGQMAVDELKAKGEDTKWLRQEERDLADLDRTQQQLDNSKAQEVAAQDAIWGAVGNIGSAAMSTGFNISGNNAKNATDLDYDPNSSYGREWERIQKNKSSYAGSNMYDSYDEFYKAAIADNMTFK